MWNPSDYKNNTALGHKGIDINEERRRVLINNICSMTKQHAYRCVKIKFLKFYSIVSITKFLQQNKVLDNPQLLFPSGKSDEMKSNMNVRRKMELRKILMKM